MQLCLNDDPGFAHFKLAFAGVGLRPYAPAQLRARLLANDNIKLNWVRRTRIDGESWQGTTTPFQFEVAQVSAQFGPGPFKRISFDG